MYYLCRLFRRYYCEENWNCSYCNAPLHTVFYSMYTGR